MQCQDNIIYGWIRSVLEDTKRPKVSGLSEMVVKRRLESGDH